MAQEPRVVVDLSGIRRLRKRIHEGLKGRSGHIRNAITQWIRRYLGFTKERFDYLSKSGGGGEWAPLKKSTIEQRRHGRKGKRGKRALAAARLAGGGQVSILRDTGTLFTAIDPDVVSAPGSLRKQIAFGAEVGFGGQSKHPGSDMTIADIAVAHQTGAIQRNDGVSTKREILVEPTDAVLDAMADDMVRGVAAAIRDGEIPGTGD